MGTGLLLPLAISLALGLLVGLQREWSGHDVAGIRSFALITLLGCLAAFLGSRFGGWIVPAGLLCVGGLVAVAELGEFRKGGADTGVTTEIAALVMYGVGAMVGDGAWVPGVVVAGTVAVLLQWKVPLHRLVRSLGDAEVRALFEFVLVALVILPLLPDHSLGAGEVLNPFRIWLMVVLVVGISSVSWVLARAFRGGGGVILTGILGGLISSTATTVGIARREGRREGGPLPDGSGAVVVALASAVMLVRVGVEIAIVAPVQAREMLPPLALLLLWLVLLTGWALRRSVRTTGYGGEADGSGRDSDLRGAILFALLYAGVLLGASEARDALGSGGLYGVAFLSGLTDVDAITLSISELVRGSILDPAEGWRLILVGTLANFLFKIGAVWVLGPRRLAVPVLGLLGGTMIGGGVLALWWR